MGELRENKEYGVELIKKKKKNGPAEQFAESTETQLHGGAGAVCRGRNHRTHLSSPEQDGEEENPAWSQHAWVQIPAS